MGKVISSEAKKAMLERLAYHSIGIVSTEIKIEHGTGIPIFYEEKYYIITCQHIIKDIPIDKLRFVYRTDAHLVLTDKTNLGDGMKGPDFKYREMFELPIRQIHKSSSNIIDLVAVELDDKVSKIKIDFFDLNSENFQPAQPGIGIVMMGFAGEIAKPFRDKRAHKAGYVLFLHTDETEVMEFSSNLDSLPNFSPEHHFLMKYYDDSQSVNPEGMSGCGVWICDKEIPGSIWRVKLRLVGVQSALYPLAKLLKAERVESIFKLLKSS